MSGVKVDLKDKGPILISGDIVLNDGEGNPIDTGGKACIALCRCAETTSSPFCDGKHKDCNYSAQDRA